MWNIAWRVAYMWACMFMSMFDSGGTCDSSVPLFLTRNSSEWSCWLKLIKGKQCITAVHLLFYNQLCLGEKSAMQWRWRVGTSRQVDERQKTSWTCQGRHWGGRGRAPLMGRSTKSCRGSDEEETWGSLRNGLALWVDSKCFINMQH